MRRFFFVWMCMYGQIWIPFVSIICCWSAVLYLPEQFISHWIDKCSLRQFNAQSDNFSSLIVRSVSCLKLGKKNFMLIDNAYWISVCFYRIHFYITYTNGKVTNIAAKKESFRWHSLFLSYFVKIHYLITMTYKMHENKTINAAYFVDWYWYGCNANSLNSKEENSIEDIRPSHFQFSEAIALHMNMNNIGRSKKGEREKKKLKTADCLQQHIIHSH